ncbi:pimeloyl-ACP methyl ester carboxylesterase [Prauserella shujinwangii]|uniref:Pimeloyl-ACP methyl ester carboxylesterase n=1 Tax=Prauserella shujinwangii TaxID=1453103 RepID=A0A2T0LMB3_9PSEU|nr:alpha/beta fold hydrolase [Prauserella shujinwangii]PRX44219.1 pimeloyl-ACP methyl ester carboxylesterase [Prauserella shujinwangii]
MTAAFSQLSPHGGRRAELPGRHGPLAALLGPELAGARATALLLPGYTGSKEDFAPLLDPLAEAGLRPVAVDLPGQYESPGPDDESRYLPSALGEVVAELVGTLAGWGSPVLLLGHSFGGLVARAAVLAGADVAGLTLLGSGPGRLPSGARLDALQVGEPMLRQRGVEAVYTLREQLDAANPARAVLAEELRAFLRERFVRSSRHGLLGMAVGLRTEPDRVDELAAALRARNVPGLVVAGEHDDAWPLPAQKDMARRLDVPFALVERAGHAPNTENPPGLLEILRTEWLSWLDGR